MALVRAVRRFIFFVVVLEHSACLFATAEHKKIKRLRKGNTYLKNPLDFYPIGEPEEPDLVEAGLIFGYTIRYDASTISEVRKARKKSSAST